MPPRVEIPVEPLAVRAKDACIMLGCSLNHLYRLLGTGDVVGFRDGGARRVLVKSIRQYVERRLDADSKPARRGPGRPKKTAASS
jgi:hypothetical protein